MRICDLTMAYNESSGGIRTYIDQKRVYLRDRTPHEHVLIVPGEETGVERGERSWIYRIKSPPTGHGEYRLLWRPDEISAALHEARPDVVELGTFFVCPYPALAYRRARRKLGRRCVVSGYFHTDIADAYVETPLSDTLAQALEPAGELLSELGVKLAEGAAWTAERYFGAVFQKCDVMLASSEHQADRLQSYGVTDARVVRLGVDTDRFHPGKRSVEARRRYGTDDEDCLVVYAGRLDEEKRVWTIVDAVRHARQRLACRLVLAGEGPAREEIESREDLSPWVTLPGFIGEKDELAELLASADVYAAAGPHETFGLSVIEAQASGLPVVGVDSGALVDRVPDGTGYLGPADDAEAMGDNIVRAYQDRVRLGESARRHVERHFSWSASFASLTGVYEELLETQTPGG